MGPQGGPGGQKNIPKHCFTIGTISENSGSDGPSLGLSQDFLFNLEKAYKNLMNNDASPALC